MFSTYYKWKEVKLIIIKHKMENIIVVEIFDIDQNVNLYLFRDTSLDVANYLLFAGSGEEHLR